MFNHSQVIPLGKTFLDYMINFLWDTEALDIIEGCLYKPLTTVIVI